MCDLRLGGGTEAAWAPGPSWRLTGNWRLLKALNEGVDMMSACEESFIHSFIHLLYKYLLQSLMRAGVVGKKTDKTLAPGTLQFCRVTKNP